MTKNKDMFKKIIRCVVVFLSCLSWTVFGVCFALQSVQVQTGGYVYYVPPLEASQYDKLEFYDYNATNKTVNVKAKDTLIQGDVIIPESVLYGGIEYNVSAIPIAGFRECSQITSVTILAKLSRIPNQAFHSCSNMTRVNIPSSVTSLGSNSFTRCSSLTSIAIPDSITEIPTYCFSYCTNLENVQFPSNLKTLKEGAFCYSGIKSLVLPNTVTTLELFAFYDCSSLETITLSNKLEYIGKQAFSKNIITSIVIPKSVTYIGKLAFWDCNRMTNAYFEDANNWVVTNDSETLNLDANKFKDTNWSALVLRFDYTNHEWTKA